MTAVLLGRHEPNTPEWDALRAGGIGGSEIAAVVGLSPYVSAFWLWHHKKGNLPKQTVSDAMDWGHRLEPVVRSWWQERYDYYDVDPTPGTFAHSERPWQRCNPDGLIAHRPDLLLEIKTSRYPNGWGRSGTDEIPLHYRCQAQWSLDVFGAERMHLAVLIGGNEPREYVIDADPEDQRVLREAGAKFWASLQADDEPPIDCSDSTYEAVRALHPEIDRDLSVEVDDALYEAFVSATAKATDWGLLAKQYRSQILAAMGNARIATHNDQPVLRRQMSAISKAIATRDAGDRDLTAAAENARMLAASDLLPREYQGKPQNVLVAAERGRALGIDPMTAIQMVHVINGRPTMSAQLVGALVRRAGHKLRIKGDGNTATAVIIRADDPDHPFEVTWTMEMAKAAGLTKNPTWGNYPRAMLKARAITECARDACPEVLAGISYTAEEIGAPAEIIAEQTTTPHVEIDDDGTAVLGEVVEDEGGAS